MKIKGFLKVLFVAVMFLSVASPSVVFADSTGTGGGSTTTQTGIGVSKGTGSGGTMQIVLCNVLRFVTGTVGKTIASFIIIGVGVGFFTGKVSWGVLIGVTLGISAMFGAPAIIAAITGDNNDWCSGYM